jgi:hypothetical protein
MSVWADKWSDIRLSLNDLYMAFLMTGWMFFLEGAWMLHGSYVLGGSVLILLSFLCIRTQAFVNIQQYVRGMIPHHSMAILMSKKLIEKYGESVLGSLPREIVKGQESEIIYLKNNELN